MIFFFFVETSNENALNPICKHRSPSISFPTEFTFQCDNIWNYFLLLIFVFIFVRFRCQWTSTTWSTNIHEVSNVRTGKRIPHKSLPNAETSHRNGACIMPHRATNKNLVPESTHEIEKRDSSNQRAQRTREAGTGTKGCSRSVTIASHWSINLLMRSHTLYIPYLYIYILIYE